MQAIIELPNEFLVDRSQVPQAYLRLLLSALGKEITESSSWVVVNKRVAAEYPWPVMRLVADALRDSSPTPAVA